MTSGYITHNQDVLKYVHTPTDLSDPPDVT
jgi:hypothetical protein